MLTHTQNAPHLETYLTSKAVRAMFGYSCPASFWGWVHRNSVPCVRLSQRRIVFPQTALNDFIAARSTKGGAK